MFEFGQKLELKKDFEGDIAIEGIFPAGDGLYKEKHYKVNVNGFSRVLPEFLVDNLFQTKGEIIEAEPKPEIKINDDWEKADYVKKAKELGIKGNLQGMKIDTLREKIAEVENGKQ